MTKRHKFLLNSFVLSLGFALLSVFASSMSMYAIGGLAILTVLLFYWSLSDGLAKNATLLVLILPGLFTLGVGVFWFLLPATLVTRIPIILFYAVGLYAISLTANILIVSAFRVIALARAAKGVLFVVTLFTCFLLYDAIFSLRAAIWINAILTFVPSFLLFLQGLWVSRLGTEITPRLIGYSLVFAYTVSALAAILYFWPVSLIVGSLFLTVSVYVLLGVGQLQIEARLFKQSVREYAVVGFFVFLVMFFSTNWGA